MAINGVCEITQVATVDGIDLEMCTDWNNDVMFRILCNISH